VHGLLQEVKSLSVLNQAKEEHAFLKTKREKDNIAKREKDWFLSVADLEIVNGAAKGRFLVYHEQAPTFRPKKEAGQHHTTNQHLGWKKW
jgi:hypothetical protein